MKRLDSKIDNKIKLLVCFMALLNMSCNQEKKSPMQIVWYKILIW